MGVFRLRRAIRRLTVPAVLAPPLLGLTVLSLAPDAGQAQEDPAIRLGPDRLVSGASRRHPLTEPHLTRHPHHAAHLLAVAIEVGRGCVAFVSFDGGGRWEEHRFDLDGCVDPWAAVLPDSTAVFAALSDGELVVARSPDGGATWEPSVSLGDGHDHPTLLVDDARELLHVVSGRGRGRPDELTRWSIFLARSGDGGRSFRSLRHVTPIDVTFEPHGAAVLSDGRLAVSFSDHHAVDGRDVTNRSWIVRSDPAGRSFGPPSLIAEGCFGPGGWPTMALSPPDSEWADRLFFACVTDAFGAVLVRRSDDAGRSWSEPVTVTRDVPRPHVAVAALAVDGRGSVVVTWYDRGDDPESVCQHLYGAVSLDGGESFLPPVRVSDGLSCPAADPANRGAARRWPHGGDYSGLVALDGGRFLALWADARDGVYRLRAAEITVPD